MPLPGGGGCQACQSSVKIFVAFGENIQDHQPAEAEEHRIQPEEEVEEHQKQPEEEAAPQ